ncbi:MAG: hypothetical protein GXO42_00870 [bacterium]|nr:hypothetical protein [bacterium]
MRFLKQNKIITSKQRLRKIRKSTSKCISSKIKHTNSQKHKGINESQSLLPDISAFAITAITLKEIGLVNKIKYGSKLRLPNLLSIDSKLNAHLQLTEKKLITRIGFTEATFRLPNLNIFDFLQTKQVLEKDLCCRYIFASKIAYRLPSIQKLLFLITPELALSGKLDVYIKYSELEEEKEDLETSLDEPVVLDFSNSSVSASSIIAENEYIKETKKKLLAASKLFSFNSALLILVQPSSESYTEYFEQAARLIYRIRNGGFPEPVIISDMQQLSSQLPLISDNNIISIRINIENEASINQLFSNSEILSALLDKINQLYSRKFSVILLSFYINNKYYTEMKNCLLRKLVILLQHVRSYVNRACFVIGDIPEDIDIPVVSFPVLSRKEKETLAASILQVAASINVQSDAFGKIFESLLRFREEKLKEIACSNGGLYFDLTEANEGSESEEHRTIKAVLAKILARKLCKKYSKKPAFSWLHQHILSELELGTAMPDIYFVDEQTVYEIETLHGEDKNGLSVRDKIKHTLLKYKNCETVKKIYLIFDALTYFLYKKDILGVINNLKDEIDKNIYVAVLKAENRKVKLLSKKLR